MSGALARLAGGRISRCCAFVALGLALPAVYLASGLGVDNRLERWTSPTGAAALRAEAFEAVFGDDEFVLVGYEGGDIFSEASLDIQLAVLDGLESASGVTRVLGVPVVYRDVFGSEGVEDLREEFLSTPFYRDFLIGEGGDIAGFVVDLSPAPRADGRRAVMEEIRRAVAPLEEAGWSVYLVGTPALGVLLDETSEREMLRTLPLALLLSLVVMVFLFRSLRATLVAVLCSGLTVVLTLGLMALTAYPLNMVTSVLPVLLWVLSLANIVHILRRYQEHRVSAVDEQSALELALDETALPCVLSSVTTAVGFLSMLTTDLGPVRELGGFAAVGLLLSLVVNLSVGPALITWFRVRGRTVSTRPAPVAGGDWAGRLAAFTSVRRGWVVGCAALVVIATLFGFGRLGVESDPLKFLPNGSDAVVAYDVVSERLTGYYALEVIVEMPEGWLTQEQWPVLEGIAARLSAVEGVARVVSPLDFLKKFNHWEEDFDPAAYVLPESEAVAMEFLEPLSQEDLVELGRLVAGVAESDVLSASTTVRLSALVQVIDSTRFLRIVEAAETEIADLPDGYSGYVAGMVVRLVQGQLSLVHTQLESFTLAFLMVFLCLLLGLRSWKLLVVSILPNVLPILCAFAAMALWEIALNAATVMVASVCLGIAVDDTVHMLSAYDRERRQGRRCEAAVRGALLKVGPAMTITTVTACIGFFSLYRSLFVPILYFGLLSGLAMIVALLADIILAPALLAFVDRDR